MSAEVLLTELLEDLFRLADVPQDKGGRANARLREQVEVLRAEIRDDLLRKVSEEMGNEEAEWIDGEAEEEGWADPEV